MANATFDVIVIGAGPGGYVAAIRAAQLGMTVACVERDNLGGICLNWGCIPTKALIRSAEVFSLFQHSKNFGLSVENAAFDFKEIVSRSRKISERLTKGVGFLFKKNGVTHISGTARLTADKRVDVLDPAGTVTQTLSAKHIVIATGARPRTIPGVDFDGSRIITSKEAMLLDRVPESMVIIGAGAIGVEFAYIYSTFGCKVTLIEMLPTILPIEDSEITEVVARAFKRMKIEMLTNTRVEQVTKTGDGVAITTAADGQSKEIRAEMTLVAIGVRSNVETIGLEQAGISLEKGYIKVDEFYRTNIEGIYAIGDVIGPPWLAHVASAEAITAIEALAGHDVDPIDYHNIPGCTYCQPQVASVGLTEAAARGKGIDLKIGRYPFLANGKALALGENQGMVKLIFDSKNNTLLGAHIVGAEATELLAELVTARSLKATGRDLFKTIHAHPTLSEGIMEAAAAAYSEAIHV
ncbi:dihydrolipoyl dehydrogenase [candidate division KSB1 bacterium]|nr:dihydrolipoyl dehydrogenase [candidate division KSB1 bacterium]